MRWMRPVLVAASCAALLAAVPSQRAHAQDAKRPIAAIEDDLVADDPKVRAKAAAELEGRFPEGAAAIPLLVDLLDDESAEVGSAAGRAIDSMVIQGASVVLRWCENSAHFNVKSKFGGELPALALESAMPDVASMLDTPDLLSGAVPPDLPMLSAFSDYHMWWPETHLLIAVFRRSTPQTREAAAAALAMQAADALYTKGLAFRSDPARASVIKRAVALLEREDELQSWVGARLLSRLRGTDSDVIAALARALSAPRKVMALRGDEIIIASRTGAQRRPVVRDEACRALGRVGRAAAASNAGPLLLESLSKPKGDEGVNLGLCVETLLSMGRESELLDLVRQKGPRVDDLVLALGNRGCRASVIVTTLVEFVRAGRPGALDALAKCGVHAKSALPELKQQMRTAADAKLRIQLASAIARIDPMDAEAIQLLELYPEDDIAVWTLAHHGPAASTVIERMVNVVAAAPDSRDPTKCFREVAGLVRLGQTGRVVPPLVRLLVRELGEHSDPFYARDFSRELCVAIGLAGSSGASALPTLDQIRRGRDPTMRVVAAQAVRRIRSSGR